MSKTKPVDRNDNSQKKQTTRNLFNKYMYNHDNKTPTTRIKVKTRVLLKSKHLIPTSIAHAPAFKI